MAAPTTSSDDVIHNVLSEESGQSSFACTHCRRQKVKCDRILPSCGHCSKASRRCDYPLTVQKPGPKAGTHRRPRVQDSQNTSNPSEPLGHPLKKSKYEDSRSSLTPQFDQSSHRSSHDFSVRSQPELRRDSTTVSTTSQSPRATTKPENPILRFVHPDHEPPGYVPATEESPQRAEVFLTKFEMACRKLGCTSGQGWELIKTYFSNMTAFSLFHRPTFEQKLSAITAEKQLQALLSALFSYALRFKDHIPSVKDSKLSAKDTLDLSCQLQQECMEECEDDDPPLHLLQSLYLVTFQKLIHGVRGKTWRMVGDCIRLAYELRLHLVDIDAVKSESDMDHAVDSQDWVLAEEKRRMWWALWEMDIFTSTIRRLPSAIDERLNHTYLPSTDDDWFESVESPSCFLVADASDRWRTVSESGNRSPQTWFILVNSYMFDAHKMGAFPEIWAKRIGFEAPVDSTGGVPEKLVPKMRDFIDNCLRCTHMALPAELNWEHRFLAFKQSSSTTKTTFRRMDNARYCIHVMFQLSRLMLSLWEVHHVSTSITTNETNPDVQSQDVRAPQFTPQSSVGHEKPDRRLWDRYVDAANLTAEIIRNSSPQHYQYVNPLIANSIWYAAASLVVAKLFGPPDFDSRTAASNFDLLVATLNKFEIFWQIPSVLKFKLRNLEDTLNHLKPRSVAMSPAQPESTIAEPHVPPAQSSGPLPTTFKLPYDQRVSYIGPNGVRITNDVFAGMDGQEWPAQDLFDFGAIPTFGFGQPDLLQPMPFDTYLDNSSMIPNDGINFNELFSYPYQ